VRLWGLPVLAAVLAGLAGCGGVHLKEGGFVVQASPVPG
jgi:hypothetical protein